MTIDDLFHGKSFIPRLNPIACLACIIIFVALNVAPWEQREVWGYLPDSVIWNGKPWVLITSTFVHVNFLHFFFNLSWLWSLGNVLEDEIGPVGYLFFFVGSAIVSSAYQLLFTGDMGIGMSGVIYAMFGFGWIARRKMRGFQAVLNQQAVNLFLIWLVFCIVMTYANILNIGNVAHFMGMVFGVVVAGIFVERGNLTLEHFGLEQRLGGTALGNAFVGTEALSKRSKVRTALLSIALSAMLLGSVVPLFWCPTSGDWVTQKAEKEDKAGHYQAAVYWYERSIRVGKNPIWAWLQIAELHRKHGDMKAFNQAFEKSSKAAVEAEAEASDTSE